MLDSRRIRLIAAAKVLCTQLEQGFVSRRAAVSQDLREVLESPELVAALNEAVELLKLEFDDTDGRGQQTLVRCEKALRRARSRRALVLSLD